MKRVAVAVLALASSACVRRVVECNDTITCREMAADREQAFAKAVAAEPPAVRLGVEAVSEVVLVDRQRQLVYALDPVLVALDLPTGQERWRAPSVSGDALWRVGRFLAVTNSAQTIPARVSFVDPEAPATPVACTISIDAPSSAERASLQLFDRAGQPYLLWQSSWSYRGGTAPGEDALERQRTSQASGISRVDPLTCAASAQPLRDFVWEPKLGSPMLDVPAVVASAPVRSGADLRVTVERTRPQRCLEVEHVTLEAKGWKHPLADRHVGICAPP